MSDEMKEITEVKEDTSASPVLKADPAKKKLSAQQQREHDRMMEAMAKINVQADRMYRQMQDKFMDFFMASDNPEGEAVQQRIKQLNAQWKIYCMSKNLRPDIYDSIKKYCDKIVEEFKQGMQ